MITEKEISKIKDQVHQVIEYSQGIEEINTINVIINKWAEAKKYFIERMGDKLIYELPQKVSFSLTEEDRAARFNSFVDEVATVDCDLADLIISNGIDGFYSNRINFDKCIDVDGKMKTVHAGDKLLRTFKYFLKDELILDTYQTMASRYIQEDKIEGRLCVSVHPLDFLSSSENTLNWRSCHSLDGEFRAGNLSYMMDKSTFIVYLKTEEEVILPHFPIRWNNKKWRTLLFMSDDIAMIMAGRSYPFAQSAIMDVVLKELLPSSGIIEFDTWSHWHNEKIKSIPMKNCKGETIDVGFSAIYYPVGDALIEDTKFIFDADCAPHYNDLLYSSFYEPIYSMRHYSGFFRNSYPMGATSETETRFHIGSEVSCLRCGHQLVERGEGLMTCIHCEEEYGSRDDDDFHYCKECGKHFHNSHGRIIYGRYDDSETYICEDCAIKYYLWCDRCGRWERKEKMYIVEASGDRIFSAVCEHCLDYYYNRKLKSYEEYMADLKEEEANGSEGCNC